MTNREDSNVVSLDDYRRAKAVKAGMHPWLATPEALRAAEKAVTFSRTRMGAKVTAAAEELGLVALEILTECAFMPREYRYSVTTVSGCTGAHIGAMWEWPEGKREYYAIREVGYCLNNYLRILYAGLSGIAP